MKLCEVKVGEKLEIIITRNGSSYRTNSKIEYADEKFIGVTPITGNYGLLRFEETDEVDLIYYNEDKYWKWSNVKAGTARRKDGSRLHVFLSLEDAQKVNRRTQFRFEIGTEITMKYEVLKSLVQEENTVQSDTPTLDLENVFMNMEDRYDEYECRGYLKDLSEGGASVESDVLIEKGSFIKFVIESEIGEVFLRGVILRAKEDKHGYFDYTYGISFVETSKNYLQYFYLQQRKQLYENKD